MGREEAERMECNGSHVLQAILPIVSGSGGGSVAADGSPAALAAYAKHDAHAAWMKSYEKVRVAGTTTIDILTQ